MYDKFVRHIRAEGWHIVHDEPDEATRATHARIVRVDRRGGGRNAFRTDLNDPEAQRVVDALTEVWGDASYNFV